MRFASHRDIARAFERALRAASVPMAYSAGFSPHPRISYVGAAPTGCASEAEYLELGLSRPLAPQAIALALNQKLPEGLLVLTAVPSSPGSFADRIQASQWRIELPDSDRTAAGVALVAFRAQEHVTVDRPTKDGTRPVDARAAVLSIEWAPECLPDASSVAAGPTASRRAILDLVVRQVTPAVRPDDVLSALRALTGFVPALPPRATRVAQGPITGGTEVTVGDPLGTDQLVRPADAPLG